MVLPVKNLLCCRGQGHIKTASLIKKLQLFCCMGGFCLLVELHLEESACNLRNTLVLYYFIWEISFRFVNTYHKFSGCNYSSSLISDVHVLLIHMLISLSIRIYTYIRADYYEQFMFINKLKGNLCITVYTSLWCLFYLHHLLQLHKI